MRLFLIGSLASVALACGPSQRIDVCRRGDRVDVASFEVTALDGDGALLDKWTASADHSSTSEGPIDKTRHVRVEGLDSAGSVVAFGETNVTDPDSVCVCVASSTQYPIACKNVVCHVVGDRCTFSDETGAPLGVQRFAFGENVADDVTQVTSDTSIDGGTTAQSHNYGGEPVVMFRGDPASPRIGLLHFDLRAIPRAAQVSTATLAVVTSDNATANPIDVYEVLEDWEPGTGHGDPGCSNWTCRTQQAGLHDWATPGAGAPGSSASTPLFSIHPDLVATRYESSSDGMRQLVQDWIQTPADNHGVVGRMIPSTSDCDFVSSEGSDGARPELVIELVVQP